MFQIRITIYPFRISNTIYFTFRTILNLILYIMFKKNMNIYCYQVQDAIHYICQSGVDKENVTSNR